MLLNQFTGFDIKCMFIKTKFINDSLSGWNADFKNIIVTKAGIAHGII
jgi:hypothetical protein